MEKLRKAVNEIAYAHDHAKLSPLQRSFVPVLSIACTIYKLALSLRRALYNFGLLREHRLPVPLICVGNLTWGGNGKTPMVEFIARWLADSGISPLILTRGYAGGDEAKMLQRHLLGRPVKIAIGANRAAIASSFLKEYGYVDPHSNNIYTYRTQSHPDSERIGAAILDDGMQHWSLRSDLKIVMVNGLMPWGNSQLLPLGPLREPLNALERADVVVLHHADLIPEQSLKDVELTVREIKESLQSLPIFFTRMAPSHFFDAGNINSKKPLTALSNTIVLCVSAIGSANAFVQGMKKLGAHYVDQLEFSDHHIFQPEDIEMIRERLGELEKRFGTKPVVIVTEKDYDRDPAILKQLDPFQVMALCSDLQFIPNKECTEHSFKKLVKELLEHKFPGPC